MRRQRNNLVRLPWDVRERVCRLLDDGATYDDIRAEIAPLAPRVKLHNSTLIAYGRGAEFTRWRDERRLWREKLERRRLAASAIQTEQGAESVAAELQTNLLLALQDLQSGGQIADLADIASVTKALVPIYRAQLARREGERKSREAALQGEIDAINAAMDSAMAECRQQLAAKDAEIARLKAGGTVDLKTVADRMDKLLTGGGNQG